MSDELRLSILVAIALKQSEDALHRPEILIRLTGSSHWHCRPSSIGTGSNLHWYRWWASLVPRPSSRYAFNNSQIRRELCLALAHTDFAEGLPSPSSWHTANGGFVNAHITASKACLLDRFHLDLCSTRKRQARRAPSSSIGLVDCEAGRLAHFRHDRGVISGCSHAHTVGIQDQSPHSLPCCRVDCGRVPRLCGKHHWGRGHNSGGHHDDNAGARREI